MRAGKYDILEFEASKQDLSFMLREAERNVWGVLRGYRQNSFKKMLELLLQAEQEEQLEIINLLREEKIHKSGFKPITINTTDGKLTIERPRLRRQLYESKVLPKYTKNEESILNLIQDLYLLGISTRKMERALREILGKYGISPSSVSNITARIIPQIETFHKRPIEDKYVYLYLDGIAITIHGNDGKGKRYILLIAYGVDTKGIKEIIDFVAVRSESYNNWMGFLFNLYERGLKGEKLRLIIVDGSVGLSGALDGIWQRALRQRCWRHKLENVSKYLKKTDEEECIEQARGIYKADSLRQANKRFQIWKEKWNKSYPKAVQCIQKDLDELLTIFHFDESHRRKLRTTNPIERAFKEFRRRTNIMDNHLPNISSCEKIFYIMCKFLNERWQDKRWLFFKDIERMPDNLPERIPAMEERCVAIA
ncbi:MAG: IS256 family transposase [Candidatus Omnitrophica bacterium]|nr:IS256 family transposase [Candidatus Omnitrophota bacterium]